MDNVSYEIAGQNFTSLAGFYEEIGRVLIPGQAWGKNLDSFNDILFWPSEENGRRYT